MNLHCPTFHQIKANAFEVGKVNLCSPDHISLLVHRTFNVSIPRHHIPTDNWEFEYGPAENDPEFGAQTGQQEGSRSDHGGEDRETSGGGKWIHKVTAEPLGGREGHLKFTVVGYVLSFQMIRLMITPRTFKPHSRK